ncbi:MAG: hypothetical protein K2K89_01090 [Ruminococcus sp.]|nr:hypothetical protein [Ruminococcus sp.]
MKAKILILCFSVGLTLLNCNSTENDSCSTSSESVFITNIIPTTTEILETELTTQSPDYIVNTNTGKFHYPNCPSVDLMIDSNKFYYTGNNEGLLEYGYSPCGRCNPINEQ